MPSNGPETAALTDALRAGNRAFEARDYADAARHYAKIVAADGRCAVAWYNLGNARWRRGDRAGAIEAYRRAVGEDPERARAWQNLSTAHLSANDWAPAADAAAKAVSLDPSRAKAWNNLAVARFAQRDVMGAETALRRAVESDPTFAVAWANLGRLLSDAGRPDAARGAYEKALALGETDAEVRRGLARVLVTLGDPSRAEGLLEEVVRAEPQALDGWLALGDVRRARRAPASALDAYEAGSAAAEDMADDVRARLARRRVQAALELAADALRAGDREGFLRAADRLGDGTADVRRASGEGDPGVPQAVARCLEEARGRAGATTSPAWVEAVLERALGGRPAGAPGGAS